MIWPSNEFQQPSQFHDHGPWAIVTSDPKSLVYTKSVDVKIKPSGALSLPSKDKFLHYNIAAVHFVATERWYNIVNKRGKRVVTYQQWVCPCPNHGCAWHWHEQKSWPAYTRDLVWHILSSLSPYMPSKTRPDPISIWNQLSRVERFKKTRDSKGSWEGALPLQQPWQPVLWIQPIALMHHPHACLALAQQPDSLSLDSI